MSHEPDTEVDNERPELQTLQKLTGHESGLVLYHESQEAICCNWSSVNGLRRIFATGVVGLGEELPHVEGKPITDVRELLEGFTLVHDDSDGIIYTEHSGTVYEITDDVTVVTFEGWC